MFPDRLQVRMSTNGASTNVGSTATGVGDFTTLLLDINPNYTTNCYPNVWTQFTVTLSGLRLLAPRGGLPSATLSRTPGLAGLTQTTSDRPRSVQRSMRKSHPDHHSDSYGYSNTDGNGNCAPQLLQP